MYDTHGGSVKTLIKNAYVVSVDRRIGNIPQADILIEGTRIAEVRPGITAPDAEIIDASGFIAAPGLVDTHHHLWQGPMRAVTADWSLMNYFSGIRMFAATFFRPQDMYAAQLHGALEALNAGVTTTADYCHNLNTAEHAEESVRGVREAGARVIWCYGFNRPPLPQPTFNSAAERAEYLRQFAARHFASNDSLVTLGACPEESLFWHDMDYVGMQFKAAREVGARIFMHTNSCRKVFDGSFGLDAERLADAGLLGPDVVLAHMNQTLDREWAKVADAGSHVTSTPETEIQMSMGWPVTGPARAHGINIGFGIDITSNNSADLRVALRLALHVEQHLRKLNDAGAMIDGVAVTCEDALHWGTLGGAAVCGLDHKIGSITPGKAADIVLYRADDITLVGWDRSNPAATIIMQAGVDTVDTVLVDGKVVKRHGRLTGPADRACSLLRQTSDYVYEQAERLGGFKKAVSQKMSNVPAHIAAMH
jgi:cytosine/adenosine deaminase-related metal-dependent hydrolase